MKSYECRCIQIIVSFYNQKDTKKPPEGGSIFNDLHPAVRLFDLQDDECNL